MFLSFGRIKLLCTSFYFESIKKLSKRKELLSKSYQCFKKIFQGFEDAEVLSIQMLLIEGAGLI
jgi:hypothetical protein